MGKTIVAKISDAAITRHSLSECYQIRDEKTNVRLRFHQNRRTASWFIVDYSRGKTIWRKVGNWPAINSKALFERLPQLNAQMAVDASSEKIRVGQMHNVAQVLAWYLNRVKNDRNLSAGRKSSIKTAIRKHLTPRLGLLRLDKLERSHIDKSLMWPLQADYSLATVKAIFSVLKAAMRQAEKIGVIERDPCASMKFTDFISAEILPKGSRLRPHNIEGVLEQLQKAPTRTQFMILMMLMYGTRLNETVLTRKSDISFVDQLWFIPENHTKTRKSHELPLTVTSIKVIEKFLPHIKGRYVFPSRKGKALSGSSASKAVREVSGGEWSAHDLRKVARTIWQDQGVDYYIGELMLNHSLSKLDKAYIHTHAKSLIQKEFETYHQWLLERGLNYFCK